MVIGGTMGTATPFAVILLCIFHSELIFMSDYSFIIALYFLLVNRVVAFLTDEGVGLFFYFQFSLEVNFSRSRRGQSLAKRNIVGATIGRPFFFIRWLVFFFSH